jgi:hypothetical protein
LLCHDLRMVKRRARPDALEITREIRWLVVRDRLSRSLEYRELPAGTNLRAAMAAKQTELAAAGWRVDSIPTKCGFFFADRDNDRVCVAVECFEPASRMKGRGAERPSTWVKNPADFPLSRHQTIE